MFVCHIRVRDWRGLNQGVGSCGAGVIDSCMQHNMVLGSELGSSARTGSLFSHLTISLSSRNSSIIWSLRADHMLNWSLGIQHWGLSLDSRPFIGALGCCNPNIGSWRHRAAEICLARVFQGQWEVWTQKIKVQDWEGGWAAAGTNLIANGF